MEHEQWALDCLHGAGGAAEWRQGHVLTGRADPWRVNMFPVTFFLGPRGETALGGLQGLGMVLALRVPGQS